jgi:hypothetical protein
MARRHHRHQGKALASEMSTVHVVQLIWTGVLLQVCGVDVPLEDRDFVRLYPQLDPMLVSRQGIVLCAPL